MNAAVARCAVGRGRGSLAACRVGESILNAGNEPPPTTTPPTTGAGDGRARRDACRRRDRRRSPHDDHHAAGGRCRRARSTPSTAATGPGRDHVLARDDDGRYEDALVELTDEYNASQDRVRVVLQNQGGYKREIDKYLQSEPGQPARHGPDAGVHRAADRRHRTRSCRSAACIAGRAATTSRRSSPGAARATRPRRAVAMPFNVSGPGALLQQDRFQRGRPRPGGRRRRWRSCGRVAGDRRSGAAASASPSTPGSTPAAGGSSSSGSPGPASRTPTTTTGGRRRRPGSSTTGRVGVSC